MDEWFLPHMAMGFACWDLTNNAVSLLTVYPKKPVPYGWFVLCTLTMMWSWQQSSLQHIVRLPQGALVDGSLCISQSFRHNLHQIRNSSGVWLINYFNLGEVFSFLEDHISVGHCGQWTWTRPESLASSVTASPFRLHSCSLSIPLLLSVPLSLGCPGHFACGSCFLPNPCFHHSSLPTFFFDFGMNFVDILQEFWLGWENPGH